MTGGSGLLLVTANGVAGRISGTVVVTLPAGTTLSGALTLALNTTSTAVTSTVTVGGTAVVLDVRGGPYVRFEGVSLTDRPGNYGHDLVTGANFEVSKNLLVKAENNHFWGGPNSSLGTLPGSKYNEIKAAVSFGF